MLIGNVESTGSGRNTALHLGPLDPLLDGFCGVRALLFMQTGDFRSAARYGDKAATTPSAHYLIATIALAANSLAGQHDQDALCRQEVRRRKADATDAHYSAAFPTRNANSMFRIAAELRRHGF